jgi:hypothetical protein
LETFLGFSLFYENRQLSVAQTVVDVTAPLATQSKHRLKRPSVYCIRVINGLAKSNNGLQVPEMQAVVRTVLIVANLSPV